MAKNKDAAIETAQTNLYRDKHRRTTVMGVCFLLPVVLYLLIFLVTPIFRSIYLSMQNWDIMSFVSGEADFIGLGNYQKIFADPDFPGIALNTLLFTVASLVFQFILGLALAVFFTKRFPLSATLRSLILLPWLLPVISSATVWRWMFNQSSGIINFILGGQHIGWLSDPHLSLWAVIIANIWLGIPFNMVMLYGGLQDIPEDLYEAASIDGANSWNRFRYITWPLLKPVTAVTLLLGLVYTVKAFDIIWVLTKGGPANSSHTIATWSYQMSFEGNHELGLGTAAGELLVVVALIFGFLYLRAQNKERY